MKWDAEKYDSVKAPQADAGRQLFAVAMSYERNRTEKGIESNFRRLFAMAEK